MSDARQTGNLKLLIAERAAALPSRSQSLLEAAGHRVLRGESAEETLRLAKAATPDVCIIDLGAEGFGLARALRADSGLGIILLGDDRAQAIAGLEQGADDFLTKPFAMRELLARIQQLARRLAAAPLPPEAGQAASVFGFAGWQLDVGQRRLGTPAGVRHKLSGPEALLLAELVEHAGQVVSRDQLSLRVRKRPWRPQDRNIDILVARLRQKFRRHDRSARFIATVHGLGYAFTAAPEPLAPAREADDGQ